MPCYHQLASSSYQDFEVDQQENALYLRSRFSDAAQSSRSYTQRNRVLLPGNAGPEAATLLHYSQDTPARQEEEWLVVKQHNHYGLYSVSFPGPQAQEDTVRAHNRQKHSYVYTGTDLACKELLPPVMDSISRFDNQGYLKLLICRDGLKGIYPVQTRPGYRYLGKPTSGFVRFELKNGIKGWLNLQRKEELTDQD